MKFAASKQICSVPERGLSEGEVGDAAGSPHFQPPARVFTLTHGDSNHASLLPAPATPHVFTPPPLPTPITRLRPRARFAVRALSSLPIALRRQCARGRAFDAPVFGGPGGLPPARRSPEGRRAAALWSRRRRPTYFAAQPTHSPTPQPKSPDSLIVKLTASK